MGGMEMGGAEEEQVKGHTACGSEDAWRAHACTRTHTHTQTHTHPDQHPGQEQEAEALPAHPPTPECRHPTLRLFSGSRSKSKLSVP